jgi:hypothetical protein
MLRRAEEWPVQKMIIFGMIKRLEAGKGRWRIISKYTLTNSKERAV